MNQKKSVWEYLFYALYAFAGLGVEILLISLLEPMLFGEVGSSNYSALQKIIHWLLTILCWGVISFLLIRNARKKLSFDVISDSQPSKGGLAASALLVLVCIILNAFDWGTLKIIGEFQGKGPLLFAFQYIYYFFEVVLVFLIVAFGQKFFETLMKKSSNIPWGGLVLCCTWGAIHVLTKGSIATGIGVMIFAFLFGLIYLMLGRNSKYSYLALVVAFVI